jgi:outer membrane usher protein FimD/PapC
VLLIMSAFDVGAQCPGDAAAVNRQGAERMGILDVVVAGRRSPGCQDATALRSSSQRLEGVRLRLDNGPVDAEYYWSRAFDQSLERHGVSLAPALHGGLSMRADVERAVPVAGSGAGAGTRLALETAFDLDGLQSQVSLLRESRADDHVAGADLRIDASLFEETVSAYITHGEWHVDGSAGDAGRRVSNSLGLDYLHGETYFSAGYAHRFDPYAGERTSYAVTAALPLGNIGLRGHTANLQAEMTVPRHGNATQAVSVTNSHPGQRGRRRTARLGFSQSGSGEQQTTMALSRRLFHDLTLESAVRLRRGSGTAETAVSLDARYRF